VSTAVRTAAAPRSWRSARDGGVVVAIDVGGTSLKGAVLDRRGALLASRRRATPHGSAGGEAVVEAIAQLARELLGSAGGEAPSRGSGGLEAGSPSRGGGGLAAGSPSRGGGGLGACSPSRGGGGLGAGSPSRGGRAARLAVAVPGLVDDVRGSVAFAANLGWRDVALRERLETDLGLATLVWHDARAAALAEQTLGAARGVRDWMLVTIGTGIGGAVVSRGAPVVGRRGTAGELGHMPIAPAPARGWRVTSPERTLIANLDDPVARTCGCGRVGCLETIAGGAAIAARYAERAGAPTAGAPGADARAADARAAEARAADGAGAAARPTAAGTTAAGTTDARPTAAGTTAAGTIAAGPIAAPAIDAAGVARLASAGDPVAHAVWSEAIEALAAGLAGCAALLDPELVVVGGGVASAGPVLLAPLARALDAHIRFPPAPRVRPAELGERAGWMGAALAGWTAAGADPEELARWTG
jgi:glucokinase